MKKYLIRMDTKNNRFRIKTNSLEKAKYLADLKIWERSYVYQMLDKHKSGPIIYMNSKES